MANGTNTIIFSTKQDLTLWLNAQGVDTDSWGMSRSKSIDDLWNELLAQDCYLSTGPKRIVRIAVILIENGGKLLFEEKQELKDGRIRSRNKPPREKIQEGESVLEAVKRCVEQELSLSQDLFNIVQIHEEPTYLTRESDSYPGLTTVYSQHFAKVYAPSLPGASFETEERGHEHDPVRRHWWTWADRSQLDFPI